MEIYNLSKCHGVIDGSALGGVHTLDLSFCKAITDVHPCDGFYTLHGWCSYTESDYDEICT